MRALALRELARLYEPASGFAAPRLMMPAPPPPLPGSGNRRAVTAAPIGQPARATAALDPRIRGRLLDSAVQLLSQAITALPAPGSVSYMTAQLARDALWQLAGRNMSVALVAADRIVPSHGRYASAGRFGESYDLAAKDREAYVAARLPGQLLALLLAALAFALLAPVKRLQTVAVAMIGAICLWAAWLPFQTDMAEFPPPPMWFVTASGVGFLTAGAVAGLLSLAAISGVVKVLVAPFAAAIGAAIACFMTRSAALYPIGSEGWNLLFDPVGSAVLAAPAAFLLSLGIAIWKR